MTIKHLLAAVSMVAITATHAHAQVIAAVTPTNVTPAAELDGAQTATGAAALSFRLDGSFNAGVSTFVITLPTGVVFSTGVVAGNATSVVGASTVTVTAGGAVGNNTVTFDVDFADGTATGVLFQFTGKLNGCPAATSPLTVNVTGSITTPGTATDATIVNACAPSLKAPVVVANGTTEIASAGGFNTLSNTGTLGTVLFDVADVATSISLDASGFVIAADNTSHVESVAIPVEFAVNANGIENLTLTYTGTGTSLTSTNANGKVFTFNVPQTDIAKLFDGAADVITANETAPNAEISPQAVVINTSTVNLSDVDADLVASTTVTGGALATLKREGENRGPFAWNSGAGRSTNSVYRVTTNAADGTYDFSVTLSNAGAANNGTTRGQMTITNGQAIIQSANGFGIDTLPSFANGDVTFNFEIDDNTLNVDRLLLRGNTLASSATLD